MAFTSTTLRLDAGVAELATKALEAERWDEAENLLLVLHTRGARDVAVPALDERPRVSAPPAAQAERLRELIAEVTALRPWKGQARACAYGCDAACVLSAPDLHGVAAE